MSSIDKGVVDVARRCDSRIKVVNDGSTITGSIDGQVIFRLRDRYGYINDEERRQIFSAFSEYKREQESRAHRLEEERKQVLREVQAAREEALRRLESSYRSAETAYESAKKGVRIDKLSDLSGYDLSAYRMRGEEIEREIQEKGREIGTEYERKKRSISAVSVPADASLEECERMMSRFAAMDTTVRGGKIPTDKLARHNADAASLRAALSELETLKGKLASLKGEDLLIEDIERTIAETPIASLSDAEALARKLESSVKSLSALIYKRRGDALASKVEELTGVLTSLTALRRRFSSVGEYRAADFSAQVEETAARVLEEFAGLASKEYTSCSSAELAAGISEAQEALIGGAGDEETLKRLKRFDDMAAAYEAEDRRLEPAYRKFAALKREILSRGGECEERFQPRADGGYEQRKRLEQALLELDLADARSATFGTASAAIAAMEEMGYVLVSSDLGSKNALAAEFRFAIPGVDGVMWQMVVSDNVMRRRLMRIKRESSGVLTSSEYVVKVAEILDREGEGEAFLERFCRESGYTEEETGSEHPPVEVGDYQDAAYGGAEAVRRSGFVVLSEDAEEVFDAAVRSKELSATPFRDLEPEKADEQELLESREEDSCNEIAAEVQEKYMQKRLHAD